jgi:hypothetical protein
MAGRFPGYTQYSIAEKAREAFVPFSLFRAMSGAGSP